MNIKLNGEDYSCQAGVANIARLVVELGLDSAKVAVELNREIVSRSAWDKTPISTDDEIEIIHFVGGG